MTFSLFQVIRTIEPNVILQHDRTLFGHSKGYRDLFVEKIGDAKNFLKRRGQFATQRRLLSMSDRNSMSKDDSDTLFKKYLRVCKGEDLRVLVSKTIFGSEMFNDLPVLMVLFRIRRNGHSCDAGTTSQGPVFRRQKWKFLTKIRSY